MLKLNLNFGLKIGLKIFKPNIFVSDYNNEYETTKNQNQTGFKFSTKYGKKPATRTFARRKFNFT